MLALLGVLGLFGCSPETESTSSAPEDKSEVKSEHVWQGTTQTIDRARAVEQTLDISVKQKQQQMEEATR